MGVVPDDGCAISWATASNARSGTASTRNASWGHVAQDQVVDSMGCPIAFSASARLTSLTRAENVHE